MRVVIECFMQYVYIKGLHQLLGLLKGSDDSSDTMYSSMELEVIFDSLSDLVSDNTYITTLFISFDCDPQRPDILQPLFHYLSRCARHFLYISNENSPSRYSLTHLTLLTHLLTHSLTQVVILTLL